MPMTEDQMSDPHTRLAQARFEKELQDSEQNIGASEDAIFFAGAAGIFIFCLLGILLLLGTFVSVIAFLFAILFSQKRVRLVRDAAFFAAAGGIAIFLIASAGVISNLFDYADFFAYAQKVATFSDSEKKGIGAIAFFTGREGRAEFVFMNYQQTGIFLLALPMFTSLWRNSNQLRLAWHGFNDFMNSFEGKHDYVREVAGIKAVPAQTVLSEPSNKITPVDFGQVGYDRQPETPHNFDADSTDEQVKFRSLLRATMKQLSPDLDPSKARGIAKILHREFGFKASDYTLEALDDLSASQANLEMQSFVLAVCRALVKINGNELASKAG